MRRDRIQTAVVEARVDIRDLATCADFFLSNEVVLNSRSDLIWRIVRSMAETLAMSGAKTFSSTEDAAIYMDGLHLGSWNRVGRAGKPLNRDILNDMISSERASGGKKSTLSADDFDPAALEQALAAMKRGV